MASTNGPGGKNDALPAGPPQPLVHDSILSAIGETPLVRLPAGFEPGVECEILLKVEFTNPSGSIKDRIALFMVREAERKGLLKPGGRIVECSSGNTGVGLCLVAAALGYLITIVIPDKMSQEKIDVLLAYVAEVAVPPSIVSYTPLRAHETLRYLVCRLLLEKKNNSSLVYCT